MNKRNIKKLMLATMTFTLLFILTACRGTAEKSDRLVVAQNADAKTLDPHGANEASSSLVITQLFDTLFILDEDRNIVPGLAEEYTLFPDNVTYEFKLREDVYFHNGEKMTAEDVAFSFKRAAKSPHVSHIVGQIDPNGIEILDDYKIRVTTKEPYAPFLANLTHSAASIMNEKAVLEAGEEVGRNPIGTGPFELVKWNTGNSIEMQRFEDHHGELPVYSELEIRVIAENSNRAIELEAKGVDIAINIDATDMGRIDESSNLTLLRKETFSTQHIGFNQNVEPFNNVLVRQAINYAVNVPMIHETLLTGVGSISKGPINTNVWGAKIDLPEYKYNLEKARELMADAGYEGGFTTELWVPDSGAGPIIAEAVASQLTEIGIDANITLKEWGAYIDAISNNDHEMYFMAWSSVTGDADYGLYSLFHSSQSPAAGNRTFFVNERVDELLEMGRSTIDEAVRLEIYAELQEIIVEEAPWLFLVSGETLVGIQGNIRGLRLNPTGQHRFAGVYFETENQD